MRYIVVFFFIFAVSLSGCTRYVEMADITLQPKEYPKPDRISRLSFAIAQPVVQIKTELSDTVYEGLFERLKYNLDKTACYLNKEVDKILLTKGFTITNRYPSYNAMTYSQKRNTSALFYPEITIYVEEKPRLEITRFLIFYNTVVRSKISVSASVRIVMLEPLSGEIIWVKMLPIPDVEKSFSYEREVYLDSTGTYVPEDLVPMSRELDAIFENIAQEVIKATETYIEEDEFSFLDEDIRKLKTIKRY